MYNFKINKLAKDVYEIENFLDQSEISSILEIINNSKTEDWFATSKDTNFYDFWYDKSLYLLDHQELCKKIVFDKVDYIFRLQNTKTLIKTKKLLICLNPVY